MVAITAITARSVALAYLAVQYTLVLVTGYHPQPSAGGMAWTAVTARVTRR